MFTRLEIRDFRNIASARLDLDRVNWICGPSGGGKTSIGAAIEFCLTGGNEWTDGRGQGLDTQVRHGQKEAEVALMMESNTFRRTIPQAKAKALDGRVEAAFQAKQEVMRHCLRTRLFFALSRADQKELLQSALTDSRNAQAVVDALDAFTPEFPDLGSWLRESGEFAGGIDFDAMHRRWYDERTGQKRDCRSLEERVKMLDGELEPPQNTGQSDLLRAELRDLDRRIGEAQARTMSATSVYSEQKRAHETAEQCHKTAATAARVAQDAVSAAADAMFAMQARVTKLHGQQPEVLDLGVLRAEQDALAQAMAETGAAETCPPGECAKVRMRDASAALARNADSIRLAEAALAHHHACDRAREAERHLQSIEVPDAPAPPADPDACEEKVLRPLLEQRQKVDVSLRAAEGTTNNRVRWESTRRELAGLREKLQVAQTYVLRLEAIVSALGPHGIRQDMIDRDLTRLEGLTSNLCENYFEMGLRFVRNPWGAQGRVWPQGAWLPVEQLSWSERARVSACFQVALAEMCGFDLVLIDETGGDPQVRGEIAEMLLDQVNVQSFMFSTAQDADDAGSLRPPNVPEIEGMRVYWMDGGIAAELTCARIA